MPDRIILINKPLLWTSFDVVKKLKRPLLDERKKEGEYDSNSPLKRIKVGHAGTLDPLATGLLVVCSGKFTKKIPEIQSQKKEYTGTITIGAITDSYDLEQPVHTPLPFKHITEEEIIHTAKSFLGDQLQSPPIHSARKLNGKRAYELARGGEEFSLPPSRVHIYSFDILNISLPEISFRITCSKGTYIRSVANDFGKFLQTGAHLSALCRTRIGEYDLRDAVSPSDFLGQLAGK